MTTFAVRCAACLETVLIEEGQFFPVEGHPPRSWGLCAEHRRKIVIDELIEGSPLKTVADDLVDNLFMKAVKKAYEKQMSDLGDRMKGYEEPYRFIVPQRTPIIIRVDGRAFHTYTRRCDRPYDSGIMAAMDYATIKVTEDLQGCIATYTQSDEASFLIQTDQSFQTQRPFGGVLQKLVSLVASGFAAHFLYFRLQSETETISMNDIPSFDARVLTMPWEETPNYFLWRYRDWVRNSIAMMAQSIWSHKELHGVKSSEIRGMIQERAAADGSKDWESQPHRVRHGQFFYRAEDGKFRRYNKDEGSWTYEDFRLAIEIARAALVEQKEA